MTANQQLEFMVMLSCGKGIPLQRSAAGGDRAHKANQLTRISLDLS